MCGLYLLPGLILFLCTYFIMSTLIVKGPVLSLKTAS
jgi:hypothetical protein